MKRRAICLAVFSTAALSLAGCQSLGGYSSGSWRDDGDLVRGSEPDDPQPIPSLQHQSDESATTHTGSLPVEDPFAPISVEQFLPATVRSTQPSGTTPSEIVPAGYVVPSTPMQATPGTLVPPVPMAVMHPMTVAPNPMAAGAHPWDSGAAVGGACSHGGHNGRGSGAFTSLMDNMVIFSGGDYFNNSGMINRERLFNSAAELNVIPIDIPNLDPQRIGSMISLNAGVPFTPDGELGFQIGGTYTETEEGAQGFFTTGLFHRCKPGESWGVNWGMVYDVAYDDFIDYVIGQLRFKAGVPLTSRDEIGGWVAVGTNVEQVDLTVETIIIGTTTPVFQDTIRARVRPECHGHFFWRHVFGCGAESSIFVGGRENLGGALVVGGTAQVPVTDCWSVMSGGHWSNDSEDRGSWDVYLGIGYYPGGNARSTGACGNRFLPYLDVANNTFMPMSINPRYIQVENDRDPL